MKNIILLFSLLSVTFLFANKRTVVLKGKDAAAKISNSEIIRMKNFTSVPNYVRFKKGKEIPLANLEGWLNQFYESDATYGLKLIKKEVGKQGLSHYRYKQTISGIPVELSTLIAHVANGMVLSINGDLFSTINTSVNSSLSEATALNKALNFINAETYKWELPHEEAHLKIEQDDDNATYYPKGEQVLINRGGTVYGEMKLAYKFDIYAQKPFSRREIYIDASSGEILWEETQIHHADAVGTATTAYSGVRTITTDNTGGAFRLRESGRGNGIETYDMNFGFNYGVAVDFTDTDNNWNNVNSDLDEYATDVHWGSEMTYDYFLNEHGRNSIDGAGFKIRSYVHFDIIGSGIGSSQNNAFWDGQRMTYGDGQGGLTPLTTIDIAGHEITHGLTARTANLRYRGESGALDESFSDIFGVSIDWYARPSLANWTIGEEVGRVFRSMSNPNAFNHPDTYFGTNWAPLGGGDFGGVHTNSGVQNYWYYLLVSGGSGTNDNNDSYVVNPIGLTKAGSIAFRNLTVYLTRFSEFSDARFFAIQSAEDLFGKCSDEVREVTNAWYAVGVGSEYVSGIISDFEGSGLKSCAAPFTVNFNNLSVNGVNYTWDFGDGNTSTQNNPSNTYNTNGTYTVELVADGGSNCGIDTETKTAYISVSTPSQPTKIDASICENDFANLGATGSGVLNWYSVSSGGTAINTGGSYMTPPLSATTIYYVENVVAASNQSMGKTNNSGGGANFNNLHNLIFDVYQQMELVSVVVYAGAAGNRTIELRNSAGVVLQRRTVNIPVGTQTVNLNFNIPPGTDYQLGVSSGSMIDMFRNDQGVNYPYTLGGLASIKRSSSAINGGLDHYYFFYDWQIKLEDCVSSRVPVTAVVNSEPTIVANTTADTICAGVSVILSGSGGANYSWNNGVVDGVSFIPTVTTTYLVIGTGVGGNNCENLDQLTIVVNTCTGIDEFGETTKIVAHVNAANQLVLDLTNFDTGNYSLILLNSLGQVLEREQLNLDEPIQREIIDMRAYSKGIYYVNLYNSTQNYTSKIFN